jgi:hypothetical protein
VPQILNPVVLVLDELPRLGQNPQLGAYISAVFGSVEAARKAILTDFCRHAFDGSGADVSGTERFFVLLWEGGCSCGCTVGVSGPETLDVFLSSCCWWEGSAM